MLVRGRSSRGLAVVPLTLWAWLMMVFGLWSITELRARFTAPGWFFPLVGVVLVAMGLFVAAVTADRLYPGADRRATWAFEALMWVVIAGAVGAAAVGVVL